MRLKFGFINLAMLKHEYIYATQFTLPLEKVYVNRDVKYKEIWLLDQTQPLVAESQPLHADRKM